MCVSRGRLCATVCVAVASSFTFGVGRRAWGLGDVRLSPLGVEKGCCDNGWMRLPEERVRRVPFFLFEVAWFTLPVPCLRVMVGVSLGGVQTDCQLATPADVLVEPGRRLLEGVA